MATKLLKTIILSVAISSSAHAEILTFDDLFDDPTVGQIFIIPSTYGDFTWNNICVINGAPLGLNFPGTGYDKGRTSGQYVAFNRYSDPGSITSATPFNLHSVQLAAAWRNGLNVAFEALRQGQVVYSKIVVVNTNAPSFVIFDFLDIDEIRMSSFGGADAGICTPDLCSPGAHFVMDDFTFSRGPLHTCADIIQGSVTHSVEGNITEIASFRPNFGLTLNEAAQYCGYDHFNWLQVIKYCPYAKESNFPDPPFHDPPTLLTDLSINFLPGSIEPADIPPFYWNETTPGGHYGRKTYTSADTLTFRDRPRDFHLDPNKLADFIGFTTSLVGVRVDGTYQPLNSWSWKSRFNGKSGGIEEGKATGIDLTLPVGGVGGIFEEVFDLDILEISPQVRALMIQDGGTNIPSGKTSFYTLTPCRVLDTRTGGPISSGIPLVLQIGGACGVPASAVSVAVNITTVFSTGSGYLTFWPTTSHKPSTSNINFSSGAIRANNAILSLASDGSGTAKVEAAVDGGGTVHVLIDVAGYFQ